MDSVRFGRSLGFGARSAAKALAGAVDAATAPNPIAKPKRPESRTPVATPSSASPAEPPSIHDAEQAATTGPVVTAARLAAKATVQARQTSKGVARGSKRFREAVWGPLAKLSGVLWLEMTGAFFGIFALFASQAAWTHRADLHTTTMNHAAHRNAFVFLAMALVFGYFCISSFVRAYRR